MHVAVGYWQRAGGELGQQVFVDVQVTGESGVADVLALLPPLECLSQ